MSESSGGGAGESLWQCRHCRVELRVPPGVVFQICPACRAPEQEFDFDTAVYCVNPDCKEKLFTPTQKRCHECTALQPKRQAQRQPKPPRGHVGQATSTTPTVPVAGVPSTSSDPIGAALPAQHLEAVKKAVEAQRNQTCKDGQSEDDTQTTSPQHMPPTHVMQGAAGSPIPPGFQAAMGPQSYLFRHVPAVRPPVPLHSQVVYEGIPTQQPQAGGHTPYPREFGPPEEMPTSSGSQSCSQVPANEHSTPSSFQGSQDSSLSPEPTGGPQSVKSHPKPPTASSQVPANSTQPSIPNQCIASLSTSTASMMSAASDLPVSTSNEGLSNNGTPGGETPMSTEEEGGAMSVSKPQEAAEKPEKTRQDQEEGQGADRGEHQLQLAVSDPAQNPPADSHSVAEHTSSLNKRKRSAENGEELADILSKQLKVDSPTSSASEGKGASSSVNNQEQKKDSTQPPNPPTNANLAASDQVCPLIALLVILSIAVLFLCLAPWQWNGMQNV